MNKEISNQIFIWALFFAAVFLVSAALLVTIDVYLSTSTIMISPMEVVIAQ